MAPRLSIRTKLFYSHFLAVLLVSGSIGTLFYSSAIGSLQENLRARLKYSAALLARTLDATMLEQIRTGGDVARPEYVEAVRQLRDYQGSNKDVAFIYVMRKEGDKVKFVLDSDASADQALPGKEYTENVPALRRGFDEIAADDQITHDEWGSFLSGYAPLKNGNGQYLVGIDMRADEVQRKFQRIRVAGGVSLLLSILLAYLFSNALAARLTQPIAAISRRAAEIAQGVYGGHVAAASGDEVGELGASFNKMSDRLSESAAQTRFAMKALEAERSSLDERVRERTDRLARLNRQLSQEVEERRQAEEALAKAATTDYLTGLFNRPALLQLIEQEVARVPRSGKSFTLVLADIDHFKRINDQFGHEVGDSALVYAADRLRDAMRLQDAIARWGGEEFLIFLPETPREGAMNVAEKVRQAFAAGRHEIAGHAFEITLSLGVCAYHDGMTITDCIRGADSALYAAKAQGRNCVFAAE